MIDSNRGRVGRLAVRNSYRGHRLVKCIGWLLGSCLTIAAMPSIVSADTLWIGEVNSNPIKTTGVKVQSVDGDKVTYTTESGASSTKPLSQLQLVNIDGETSFDAAENAYAAKNWNDALTGYQSSIQSSKDWIKRRSATRLGLTAKQAHRFDAEVNAYVTLMLIDPALAAPIKPSKAAENAPNLDAAVARINQGLATTSITTSQKSELLGVRLDIYRAKKDTANVNQTLQQLLALGGGNPGDAAMLKIAAANVAYDAKQYTQAINTIEQNRAIFTAPDQQVDALYVLATAKEAVDGSKTDPDVLKDLTLAYMRVVTFGSQLPEKTHVAESLYRAGQLQEKLKDPQAAVQLYQEILKSFGTSPVAADARTALAKAGK